jgi:hypothetical protein
VVYIGKKSTAPARGGGGQEVSQLKQHGQARARSL